MILRPRNRGLRERYLAWGSLEDSSNAVWKDDQFAIFQPSFSSSGAYFALSPLERFVVVGDVWLSSRAAFVHDFPQWLRSEPLSDLPLSDLQLIAIAWEQWGADTLSKLIGMFALAVWDREQQVLTLGRDRAGSRTLYYTTSGTTRWIAPW